MDAVQVVKLFRGSRVRQATERLCRKTRQARQNKLKRSQNQTDRRQTSHRLVDAAKPPIATSPSRIRMRQSSGGLWTATSDPSKRFGRRTNRSVTGLRETSLDAVRLSMENPSMILTIPEMDSLVCDPHWSLQLTVLQNSASRMATYTKPSGISCNCSSLSCKTASVCCC